MRGPKRSQPLIIHLNSSHHNRLEWLINQCTTGFVNGREACIFRNLSHCCNPGGVLGGPLGGVGVPISPYPSIHLPPHKIGATDESVYYCSTTAKKKFIVRNILAILSLSRPSRGPSRGPPANFLPIQKMQLAQ